MRLPELTDCRLSRRYQRFFADVEFPDGRTAVAHCANTGTMRTCWAPGVQAQVSFSDRPGRKLAWTLERVDMGGGWIGVNTMRTNPVIREGIELGRIPALAGYGCVRPEARFETASVSARLDFALSDGVGPDGFVEVKNVTLLETGREGEWLSFPDARSERALKHLNALAAAVGLGHRAVCLFALNRPDGGWFSPADAIDPAYGQRLREVVGQGVEVLAVRIRHTETGMEVAEGEGVEVRL